MSDEALQKHINIYVRIVSYCISFFNSKIIIFVTILCAILFAELNLSFFTGVCLAVECEDNIKIAFEKSGDSVIDTDDIATLLSLFNLPVI